MDKLFCIFDMDGTLVDSTGWWRRMEIRYLLDHGAQPGPELDALVARLKPLTLEDAARVFIDELGFRQTPQAIAAEMNAMMEENYRFRVPLRDGVADYLDALRRRGARMCTASATDAPLVKICLERTGIASYFDFMISCADVGASKDRPDVYLEAARRFNAAPGDCAVFEDSLKALNTAKNAGFYTVGIYDESNRFEQSELQRLAHGYFSSWQEATSRL